jgi:hypothetical protein
LIDAYEDSDEPSEGHRVVYLDIEVSTEGGFPNVEEADKEITAIAIYDSCTSKYTAFILDKEVCNSLQCWLPNEAVPFEKTLFFP